MDDLLGYISVSASPANLDALPIGFAKDIDRKSGEEFVGMTCSACHTARLQIHGASRIIEGAPAIADFSTFLSWLVDALEKTLSDPAKFTRFVEKVLGPQSSAQQQAALRGSFELQMQALRERRLRNYHTEPYGYARVDAFGHIMNELLAKDLGIPENRREPNAPVSYPFLWDTPRHDRVQWNGVAPNIGNIGPKFRNIGEVIGVFGEVNVMPRPLLAPIYPSSIRVTKLGELEELLKTLWSPKWPRSCLPIEAQRASRGKAVYERPENQGGCISCHELIDRRSVSGFKAVMTPIADAKTDPTMALNFANRTALTGKLQGTPISLPFYFFPSFFKAFGATTSGREALGNAALGVYLGKGITTLLNALPDPGSLIGDLERDQVSAVFATMSDRSPSYKARPLNGIWATAPYLHNGSVPNLEQLLTPPKDREKQFFVGSRRFDPVKLGLSTEKDATRSFLFDTSKPGNLNSGHYHGTTLKPEEKLELIEFLKTL